MEKHHIRNHNSALGPYQAEDPYLDAQEMFHSNFHTSKTMSKVQKDKTLKMDRALTNKVSENSLAYTDNDSTKNLPARR